MSADVACGVLGGHRRVYFPKNAFESLKNAPEVTLTGYTAYTTSDVTPRFGPGEDYDAFDEAAISGGTTLTVYFRESGYVFAEFNTSLGYVRAWISAGNVGV